MLATTVTCPECDAVLRLANAVAPGKKLRCPKCKTIFAVPENEEEERPATSIREKPRTKLPAKRREEVADDDEPADNYSTARQSVRKPRAEDDYAPRGKSRDGEDEEDEEAPRRTKKAGKKKKKEEQNNKGLLIGLIAGGVALLLGLFAVGAWVWPGFLKSGSKDSKDGQVADSKGSDKGGKGAPLGVPKATGKEELMAYVSTDCTLFIGLDMATLKKVNGFSDYLTKVKANMKTATANDVAAPLIDVVADSDKVLIGINPASQRLTMVVKTAKPYTHDGMVKTLGLKGQPQQVKNSICYKIPRKVIQGGRGPMQGGMGMQGMPPAGVGGIQGKPFAGFGGAQGQPPFGGGGVQGKPPAGFGGVQGRPPAGFGGAQGQPPMGFGGMQGGFGGGLPAASKDPEFLAMPNDRTIVLAQLPEKNLEECLGDGTQVKLSADAQGLIRQLDASTYWAAFQVDNSVKTLAGKLKQKASKEMLPLLDAVDHLKWLTASATVGDQLKLNVSATADSEAEAKNLIKLIEGQWEKARGFISLGLLVAGLPKDVNTAVNELVKSVKFATAGASVQLSCQISKDTLARAIEAAKNFDWSKLQNPRPGGFRR
jgi:hypothetical protein